MKSYLRRSRETTSVTRCCVSNLPIGNSMAGQGAKRRLNDWWNSSSRECWTRCMSNHHNRIDPLAVRSALIRKVSRLSTYNSKQIRNQLGKVWWSSRTNKRVYQTCPSISTFFTFCHGANVLQWNILKVIIISHNTCIIIIIYFFTSQTRAQLAKFDFFLISIK